MYRLALWSAHLGGYDPALEDPAAEDCLERVRAVSRDFWEL